jgi:hypothetical protein
MTIVNSTYNFIFVHVPKTAGTSVKVYLNQFAREGDVHITENHQKIEKEGKILFHKHSTIRDVLQAVGPQKFRASFRFSIVRNPFARAVSTYRFLKFNFRTWPKVAVMDGFDNFSDFVISDFFRSAGPGGIFRPQTHWLTGAGSRLAVSFVGRTETLEADMAVVRGILGLPDSVHQVTRINESGGEVADIQTELKSGRAIDTIRQRYGADFRLLGYPVDPEAAILDAGNCLRAIAER